MSKENYLGKKCKNCGKKITSLNKRVRFCGYKCSNKWVATNRNKKKKLPIQEDIKKFWSFVARKKKSSCWLWRGKRSGNYGSVYFQHKRHYSHRLSYELNVGPIPKGLLVCHTCDSPLCVNPNHLFVGTHQDNTQDMLNKGRANPVKGLVNGAAKMAKEVPGVMRGEGNGNSKLTESDIRRIRKEAKIISPRKTNYEDLAKRYGVCSNLISQIVRRKRWSHVL